MIAGAIVFSSPWHLVLLVALISLVFYVLGVYMAASKAARELERIEARHRRNGRI